MYNYDIKINFKNIYWYNPCIFFHIEIYRYMNIEDFNLLKRFDLQSSSIKLLNQLVACRIIRLHEEFQLFMLKKCSHV